MPAFDLSAFGDDGKIMDSWESRRHNVALAPWARGTSGKLQNKTNDLFDYVEFDLEPPTVTAGFDLVFVSTRWHDGNHGEYFGLDVEEVGAGGDKSWTTLVPKTQLKGHA